MSSVLKNGAESMSTVARLTTDSVGSHSESKKTAARFACEGPRVNAREVTATLSETGRSWPGQGEAARKLRGSLKRCCDTSARVSWVKG